MERKALTYRTDGWVPCGSGGASDCPELVIITEYRGEQPFRRIGIRSGQDTSENPLTLVFDGHEISQLVRAFNEGRVPQDILSVIKEDEERQPPNTMIT
jgi:hypothetical protein